MPYVARSVLRWGNGRISPGEVVPDNDRGRDYQLMLDAGEIEWVRPDQAPQKEPAPTGSSASTHPEPPKPAGTDIEPTGAAEAGDDLDDIAGMKELRAIADREGAPYKVSIAQQREAIRRNRGTA